MYFYSSPPGQRWTLICIYQRFWPELRNWSLIMGGKEGGGYKMGGGHVKFYSYEKWGGGAEKVVAMLKGGGVQRILG